MTRLLLTIVAAAGLGPAAALAATPMSLVIGIDGLMPAGLRAAATPEIDRLLSGEFGGGYGTVVSYLTESGGTLGTATQQATVSGPSWSTILAGVWVDRHGVTNNSFTGADFGPNPTYLEVLEERLPQVASATSVNWTPIDTWILSTVDDGNSRLDRRATPGNDLAVAADMAGVIAGLATDRPAALFVHLDEVDGAGHAGGGWSQSYLNEVTDTDARVGTLLRSIETRPSFAAEDWQVVIVSDHGHTPGGGHGGQTLLERTVPLVVTSRSGPMGAIPVAGQSVTLADVVPTVLAHFDVAAPDHLAGRHHGDTVLGAGGRSLLDGLVSHLPFDGSAATGLAGTGGTLHGTVEFTEGRFGQAAAVPAYGAGHVSLQDDIAAGFGQTTDFTMSLWVKYDESTSDPAFFSNKNWDSGQNTGINLAANPNRTLDFNTKASGGARRDLEPYGQFLPGVWQNVVFTVDRDGPTTLFMDGVPVGQIPTSSAGSFDGQGNFTFLNDVTGAYGSGATATGLMVDEFAAWNRLLGPDEITQLSFTPLAAAARPGDLVLTVSAGVRTQAGLGWPAIAGADSVTKRGAGTLVLDAANGYVGPTVVEEGTLRITAAAAVAASPVAVDSGGTLALDVGTVMRTPEVRLRGGSLEADSLILDRATGIASLVVDAGTLVGRPVVAVTGGGVFRLSAAERTTVELGGLLVDETSGGLVDLGAGEITIGAAGYLVNQLRNDLIIGRNGGAWDGTAGITSSVAAADPARAIGYLVAADGSARVAVTSAGDANLDGMVDVFDLVSIAGAGRFGIDQPADWTQGDTNYDGTTNVFDLVAIATSGGFGAGAATAVASRAVPEPSGLGVVWLAVGLPLIRLLPPQRARRG